MSELNPFHLAACTPNPDARLLPLLRSKPELASAQDAHGYSLLHAAASYNHVNLLRTLVDEFKVDVNLKDEDGETCLFVTETEPVAKCLVEQLHLDTGIRNDEGMTAVEKLESEDEYPEVIRYLQQVTGGGHNPGITNGVEHPGQLPPNVSISVDAVPEQNVVDGQEPDPEFRRRIEELASKEDFQSEEGQRELRDLITDAVRGVNEDRNVRQRSD